MKTDESKSERKDSSPPGPKEAKIVALIPPDHLRVVPPVENYLAQTLRLHILEDIDNLLEDHFTKKE